MCVCYVFMWVLEHVRVHGCMHLRRPQVNLRCCSLGVIHFIDGTRIAPGLGTSNYAGLVRNLFPSP